MKDIRNFEPLDYLRALWRRRWYALAAFVLVVAATAVYSWRMPDIYRSVSTVRIESTSIPSEYVRPTDRSSPQQQILAIRQSVQSRSFMERLVQEFQLSGYGSGMSFSMDNAIDAIRKSMQITNVSRDTFSIAFSSTDPSLAQRINRRVVETLIQSSSAARKARALEADQFLEDQIRQTEQDLVAAEGKLAEFKRAHLGELPQQSASNLNALNGLHTQLAAVENALQQARDQQKLVSFRAQDQKRLNSLTSSILSSPSLLSSAESESTKKDPKTNSLLKEREATLAALILRYTPSHPDVIRLSREVEELKRQAASANSATGKSPGPTPLESKENPASGTIGSGAAAADAMWEVQSGQLKMEVQTIENQRGRIPVSRGG